MKQKFWKLNMETFFSIWMLLILIVRNIIINSLNKLASDLCRSVHSILQVFISILYYTWFILSNFFSCRQLLEVVSTLLINWCNSWLKKDTMKDSKSNFLRRVFACICHCWWSGWSYSRINNRFYTWRMHMERTLCKIN